MDSQPLLKRILLISCLLVAFALLPLAVSAAPSAQECSPPECYPPEEPPSNPPGGGSWSGYSDGRLNPDMAEYYSVWCAHDFIEIWGGKPTPQRLVTVPIVDVLLLGDVGTLTPMAGMTLARTGDAIVISGSNGNDAPNPGTKYFSLNECLARNGSTPEIPDNPPQQPNPPPNPPDDNPDQVAARRLEADREMDFCFSSFEFFDGDLEILADCLDYVLVEYRDVLTGDEVFSLIMMVLCMNITLEVGLVPIGIVVFVRWRRRQQ